jgi:peptidyl-prolyl cis-trans isomerase SurA
MGVALVAAAVAAAVVPRPARAELVDRVAAVVNNDVITLSEVEARAAPELARATVSDPRERAEVRQKIVRQALDVLVGERLLEAQLKEMNITATDAQVDQAIEEVKRQNNIQDEALEQELRNQGYTMATYREFMRRHLSKMALIDRQIRTKVKISEEDLKAEYARWAKLESADPEIHARHIVVLVAPGAPAAEVEKARQKAQALAEEARRPGVDFAELAKAKSEGPSAAEGGDLYWFKRGVMLPEFDQVAFKLEVGQISDPVRTKFGWHVVKVEDRRFQAVKPFEEMKAELRERIFRAQMEKYTDQYVQELKASASIDVKI